MLAVDSGASCIPPCLPCLLFGRTICMQLGSASSAPSLLVLCLCLCLCLCLTWQHQAASGPSSHPPPHVRWRIRQRCRPANQPTSLLGGFSAGQEPEMSESERESAAAAKEGARAMGMLCHHHETRAPNPAAPLRQCPGSTRYATQARDRDMRIKTNSQQPAASKHRGGGGGSTLMPARRRRQVGKPGCRLAAAGKSLAEICLFALAPKKDEEESWKKATKGGRRRLVKIQLFSLARCSAGCPGPVSAPSLASPSSLFVVFVFVLPSLLPAAAAPPETLLEPPLISGSSDLSSLACLLPSNPSLPPPPPPPPPSRVRPFFLMES
ncbi:hypothetical protein H103_04862 [Trichophyton rubrum CBS 288.86]|uniref:Uncharacterized protein n=1 Tax=Trichophyton rubrum CBS 288.86 TaxID=1215330 RepID=A0A022W0M0_TRIRU|nr:hypothetical protein H100_04872 [Trichophyton rubrum MR850]EZF41290.1 hypothetical protein H102_04857 [Trichophyton rubrum CBS 100081]EZF51916.1 hypothetical protein H103_04862 [Trichophyton rubrum CBS 288.86]EZF62501.1 hypothetical protein H104_04853 [Trichophyton rubrum CBS 289.86]EZG00712.1 hypothetical protein H106_08919 [Trichophyton rubrum CBS 735.88]